MIRKQEAKEVNLFAQGHARNTILLGWAAMIGVGAFEKC